MCINIIENTYEKTDLFNTNWQKITLLLVISNIFYYLFIFDINDNTDIKLIVTFLIYEFLLGNVNNKPYNFKNRIIRLFYLIFGYTIYNSINKKYNISDNKLINNILKVSTGFILAEYMTNPNITNKSMITLLGTIIGMYITIYYEY